MDWTTVIVAMISLLGTTIGTAYGIHKSNNLFTYRLDELEKKVDIHNRVQERVLIIEETLKHWKEKGI